MSSGAEQHESKVPEITIVFWIIKIAATTLGETGDDTVTMTLNWGYLVGTAIFFSLLVVFVVWQILADKFHPFLYWTTIVASTMVGTTMADFADRATLGDFLDKPVKDGGLALSRPIASAVIAVFILGCLLLLPQHAGQHPARADVAGVSRR